MYVVKCFKQHVSEVLFMQQQIWNFLVNRLVGLHIRGNKQTTETELVEVGISFTVVPLLL
jgi:hypothetical protein